MLPREEDCKQNAKKEKKNSWGQGSVGWLR